MKQKRKAILIISITLGLILLTEILVGQFFPNLTFVNGDLTIANIILGYFAFSGFILSIPLFFKATKILTIPLGVTLFLIFFINSCAEIYPIDTTTQPHDISVLQTNEDGSKLVVRERINAKTNGIIRDTTLVKDNSIFRQIIETRK
jgi:hypothetical protein